MCEMSTRAVSGAYRVPVHEAAGLVLGHDITEIRKNEFKGPAFKKGYVIKREDISHLQRLGKEHIFVLSINDDELHEDDAAYRIAAALCGKGIAMQGEPREGKINLIAAEGGLLKVDTGRLLRFNMLGDVMCSTIHSNSVVKSGGLVAGTRAIPLLIKKDIVDAAVAVASEGGGLLSVLPMIKPLVGIVITGNEICSGRITDAFAPVIREKVEAFGGEIVGVAYAPDSETVIETSLRELIGRGANLLITTGGMSVDPDDVTRFAIRNLGATDITYGSAVLPGAMFLMAYYQDIPIVGIPACGMYHRTTVFDIVLPRVLAGERIGRAELAGLGHGGYCLQCGTCIYPACPFGK
jgi:hypothetical protein